MGGTSVESLRAKNKKRTPVVVESDSERPGSDSDTDDGTSETEEEREDSVQRIKMRKKHIIGILMAENGLKLTILVLTLQLMPSQGLLN